MLHIVTPFVSPERFQSIAQACGADQVISETVTDAALSTVIA